MAWLASGWQEMLGWSVERNRENGRSCSAVSFSPIDHKHASDHFRVFTTLAYQLARHHPKIRIALANIIQASGDYTNHPLRVHRLHRSSSHKTRQFFSYHSAYPWCCWQAFLKEGCTECSGLELYVPILNTVQWYQRTLLTIPVRGPVNYTVCSSMYSLITSFRSIWVLLYDLELLMFIPSKNSHFSKIFDLIYSINIGDVRN